MHSSTPAESPAQTNSNPPPPPFAERTHFGALDWAKDHHDFALLDLRGKVLLSLHFEHTSEGWQKLRERVAALLTAGSPALAVAIETSHGMAVEQLLEAGYAVYPVNPKKAQRYRERKAPSGVKDDALDAWSLADALRVDGHTWRALPPEDPLLAELRLLCRDEVALIEQRTALINQLQAALREYYPAALDAFDDFTQPYVWEFILAFPTPSALAKAGRRRWEKFLHVHKLWRPQSAEARLAAFGQSPRLQATPGVVAAKSRLALALVQLLRTLGAQLLRYRLAIAELFERHPDKDLFGSLPGAGPKLAPRLLAELGDQRERFEDVQSLQCYAGSAPVSVESGQSRKVKLRRACNRSLRAALHLMSDLSRKTCQWAEKYYRAHREKGQSHACALRCLGQRWLKILFKMWQTRSPYDEARHLNNQIKHGSWVPNFEPKKRVPTMKPATAIA